MATPPSALPAAAYTPPPPGPNQARNIHIQKYALPDPANPTAESAHTQLAKAMAHNGTNFQEWRRATDNYNRVLHETATTGKGTDAENADRRGVALDELRLARIKYWAPLDVATAQARAGKQPPLLTAEEWELLACAEDASVAAKTGEERAAAVQQFKKNKYGHFEGVISDDQLGRAGAEVAAPTFTRVKQMAQNLLTRGIRYDATEGEKKLLAPATEEEARSSLELSAKAKAQQLANAEFAAATTPPTQAEKDKRIADLTAAEIGNIDSTKIKARREEIDASKASLREGAEAGRKAYSGNMAAIKRIGQVALRSIGVVEDDIGVYNSEKNHPPITQNKKDIIDETAKQATEEEEKAIVHDYHHYHRLEQEKLVGAGLVSRYSNKRDIWGNEVTPIIATQSNVSEEFAATLGKLDENKGKYEKGADGKLTLKADQVLTINGVPCARVGHIDMYNIESEFSFMGFRFDDRPQRIAKMFEAWMCETTAANQGNYQGGTLSREMMMRAYASGPTLPPDGDANKNIGPNGQPINAFRISAFPVRGGVGATCRAFAEMQAIAHILGIAINIDIGAIEQNADNKKLALDVKLEWLAHFQKGESDPRYGAPALKLIQERYGIDPSWPPEKQKAVLMQKIAGNDVVAREIGAKYSAKHDPSKPGMTAQGGNAASSPAATTTPPAPTSGAGSGEPDLPSAPKKTAAPVAMKTTAQRPE